MRRGWATRASSEAASSREPALRAPSRLGLFRPVWSFACASGPFTRSGNRECEQWIVRPAAQSPAQAGHCSSMAGRAIGPVARGDPGLANVLTGRVRVADLDGRRQVQRSVVDSRRLRGRGPSPLRNPRGRRKDVVIRIAAAKLRDRCRPEKGIGRGKALWIGEASSHSRGAGWTRSRSGSSSGFPHARACHPG